VTTCFGLLFYLYYLLVTWWWPGDRGRSMLSPCHLK